MIAIGKKYHHKSGAYSLIITAIYSDKVGYKLTDIYGYIGRYTVVNRVLFERSLKTGHYK